VSVAANITPIPNPSRVFKHCNLCNVCAQKGCCTSAQSFLVRALPVRGEPGSRRHILGDTFGIETSYPVTLTICRQLRRCQPSLRSLANHISRTLSASPSIVSPMGLAMAQHRKAPEPADSVSCHLLVLNFQCLSQD
jgi:hypothetical protein